MTALTCGEKFERNQHNNWTFKRMSYDHIHGATNAMISEGEKESSCYSRGMPKHEKDTSSARTSNALPENLRRKVDARIRCSFAS